jgi:hypothetical protein
VDAYRGTTIEHHEALAMLDRWRISRREIGVIFWSRSANVYTFGVVQSTSGSRLEVRADGLRASFNLTGVSFRYGPMQTWPRWPSPPVVEVTALRAEFDNGDYLALAEDLPSVGGPKNKSLPGPVN